jgi:hypothetical protein
LICPQPAADPQAPRDDGTPVIRLVIVLIAGYALWEFSDALSPALAILAKPPGIALVQCAVGAAETKKRGPRFYRSPLIGKR